MKMGGPIPDENKTMHFAVVGDPVAHSASPALHNAAYAHLGIYAEFIAFEASVFKSALEMGRNGLFAGFAVTMPHKKAAFAAADETDKYSSLVQASNTLLFGEQIVAANTDVPGVLEAFRQSDATMKGARVVIIGAGGAARAAVVAAAISGADEIVIIARTPSRGVEIVGDMKDRDIFIRVSSTHSDAGISIQNADILINATPVGLEDSDRSPVDISFLHKKLTVMDMIYRPAKTHLMVEAMSRCALAIPGTLMFLAQAARQFELMTGRDAPIEVMAAALREVPGCEWP